MATMGAVRHRASAAGEWLWAWLKRPGTSDGVVTGTVLLIAALTLINPGVELARPQQLMAAVGAVIQAGALLFRRSHPVPVLAITTAALLATAAATGDPVAADIGVAFAVYAVASLRAPGIAWAAWGAVIAGTWGFYLLLLMSPVVATTNADAENLLTAGFTLLFVSLVALALGLTVHTRRARVTALQERVGQLLLERDQREQLGAAAERARMAREMHDVVAHSVSVMATLAHGAASALEKNPDQSQRALAELSRTGRAALADMHRLVGVLRDNGDATGDHDGPLDREAVAELIGRFQRAGLPIRVVERGPGLPDDPHLRHAIYRIVQECLTNVLRHAPDTRLVEVTQDRVSDHVTVVVANTGGPVDPEDSFGGRGLAGIRERVAAHRGTVEAGPTTVGWQVRAMLRYEDRRRDEPPGTT